MAWTLTQSKAIVVDALRYLHSNPNEGWGTPYEQVQRLIPDLSVAESQDAFWDAEFGEGTGRNCRRACQVVMAAYSVTLTDAFALGGRHGREAEDDLGDPA